MSDAPMPDSPAERWYRLATEDLQAAHAILEASGVAPRIACFLAQQAAEKALKAGLFSQGLDFPKIHALTGLLALYPSERMPAVDEDDLDRLDPWVIDGRYAADLPPVGTAEAKSILDTATRAVMAVRLLLDNADG
jgi:HEPN domain-containing protein